MQNTSSTTSDELDRTKDLSPGAKVALELCSIAKSEIIVRIRVRDTLLASHSMVAFTVIALVTASKQLGGEYLYGVPYLALAFALLVSYHHAGIGALGTYCARDLFPVLDQETGIKGFELAPTFNQYYKKNSTRRVIAHGLILLSPSTLSLILNFKDLLVATTPTVQFPWLRLLWVISIGLMGICVTVIYRSNRPHFEGVSSPDVGRDVTQQFSRT
jgi:hypothetical protein